MTVFMQGVIKGRQIKLDREPGLPEGLRVQVRIKVLPLLEKKRKRQQVACLFGSCATDPSFKAAVAQSERQRRSKPPRKVDVDVAP